MPIDIDAARHGRRPLASASGVCWLVVLAIVAAPFWPGPASVSASVSAAVSAADPAPLKAVIIVGPAAESTSEYLAEGERIARQADDQGMDVRRIFTPRATWSRVKAAIQGAKLVVYLGHGNGWPSPYGPFQGRTKNGFGLNPCVDTCGTRGPTRYFGEQYIREDVKLAPDAVVLLHRICYASGNGEDTEGPTFDRDLVVARVSNFASGFLDAGAGAVFALGWRQRLDLPAQLMTTDRTIDEIFETPRTPGWYDGFVGWRDHYAESTRNPGARIHLDPHPEYGHLRAVTGNLGLTATQWRGGPVRPDRSAPSLTIHHAGTADRMIEQPAAARVTFTPNGDGAGDRLLLAGRLSEAAAIRMTIRDAAGRVVRRRRIEAPAGDGLVVWSGRSSRGSVVRDGVYRLRLAPIDAAGNVGRKESVRVRVLTTATQPVWTARALDVADRDRLGTAVRASSSLTRRARVRWTVERDGTLVRTLRSGVAERGRLSVRWDGRDADGRPVPDGAYQAVLTARSPAGTMRLTTDLWAGPYRIALDRLRPRRGRSLRITVRSTERQAGAPMVIIRARGVTPRRIRLRADSSTLAHRTVRIPDDASPGRITITVRGTDILGQLERTRRGWRLR